MNSTHCRRILALLLCLSLLVLPAGALDGPEDTLPDPYSQLYPVENRTLDATDSTSHLGTLLEGKSILFFGDSLTAGYGLDSFEESWAGMLGSRYGMEVTCRSISGSTLATAAQTGYFPGGSFSPISQRALPEGDYDIVFVEGGGNDWYCAIPIGSDPTSRDTSCFYGALNTIIDRMESGYPNALLVFMTSWYPQDRTNSLGLSEMAYYQAMIEVCANRGVPCFQACDPELSGIRAHEADFRQKYCIAPEDSWHLNPSGQALFLPTIAQWLEAQLSAARYVGDFWDVPQGTWFSEAVQYAKDNGITYGVSEHSFGPSLTTSRAMLVAMLYRAVGRPTPTSVRQIR